MEAKRAIYSVIQFVPDTGRCESVNVGVAIFAPEMSFLDSRISSSMARVQRFFRPGKTELKRIKLSVEALRYRLKIAKEEFETEKDFVQFIQSRADKVRLTMPRVMSINDPKKDLDALYNELVGIDRELKKKSEIELPGRLKNVLEDLSRKSLVWQPKTIRVPTTKRKFNAPFAFQNGRVNFVKPEPITGPKLDSRIASLGFNGALIYRHLVDEKQSKLVVVSSDPTVNRGEERQIAKTLKDFDVRFIPYDETSEFASEVLASAH